MPSWSSVLLVEGGAAGELLPAAALLLQKGGEAVARRRVGRHELHAGVVAGDAVYDDVPVEPLRHGDGELG